MGKTGLKIGFLLAAAIALFFLSNYLLDGYLQSPALLGKELKSPEATLFEYRISKEAPFKYRLLFTAIVNTTYSLLSDKESSIVFYQVYKFWSVAFYTISALIFFWLISSVGFKGYYPLAGALIFLALPPMLMAFTLPVHTRDDTLAYSILFGGLIALIKNQKGVLLLLMIIGALTRETLLLLPLLYFLFVKDTSLIRKLVMSGLPVGVWLWIRLFFSPQGYDVWEGLRWNLSNLNQVAGFLVITFNVCWLPFLLHLFYYRRRVLDVCGTPAEFFYRSAPFALLVVVLTTFFGGIFNEIRLLYLASPWMIILFLDFLRNNEQQIKSSVRDRSFWIFAAGTFVLIVFIALVALKYEDDLFDEGGWPIPYRKWIIISTGYIFLTVLFLPIAFRVFAEKKSANGTL